ncbi:uncharacterized protein LOC143625559 [Bidens hawaiensis]|uniref:uncharacterized protein LOC143625559 n=1 Tax=Bidens hawaiensis TaxID=980011 RepID=UPI00404AC3B7
MNTAKQVNEGISDDEALFCSVDSMVDSWVMDSGSSFHAMHNGKTMVNQKVGDFGKVRIANGDVLDVTGMGDVNLVTPLGTVWNLKNVRVIPSLKRRLISVSQLDELGMEVKFGGGKWKLTKASLVIARENRCDSLYMVDVPIEGSMTVPQKKVGFYESKGQHKVQFARVEPCAKVIQAERGCRSKTGKKFGDSGSTGVVMGKVTKQRWVLKTVIPIDKISPRKLLLLTQERGNSSRVISGTNESYVSVKIEDGSVLADELELGGASTGRSGTRC